MAGGARCKPDATRSRYREACPRGSFMIGRVDHMRSTIVGRERACHTSPRIPRRVVTSITTFTHHAGSRSKWSVICEDGPVLLLLGHALFARSCGRRTGQ